MPEDLRINISRLIEVLETAQAENTALKSELTRTREQNDSYRKQITELEKKIDNLKLTGAFSGTSAGRGEAMEKIRRLIGDIDKCIALMEKHR